MITKESGVIMENFHSYYDLKLILTKKTISSPEIQKEYVSIPGRDGVIDISEELTGTIKFNERAISLEFFSVAPAQKWSVEQSDLQNKLLGKRTKIIFDDDPNYYWNGRIEKIEPNQDGNHMKYSMEINADPYKMDLNSSIEDWIWDDFDFDYGVINEAKNIRVYGNTYVYIYAGRKRTYPIITSDADMNLEYKGNIYAVTKGKTAMRDLILEEGDNELCFKGKGIVSVEYRGGSL